LQESILRRAVERGLTAADFENMTLGMIIDYLVVCNNEEAEAKEKAKAPSRMATAEDIAAF